MTATRNEDLAAVWLWAVLTLIAVAFTDNVALRTLMGAPLMLVMTGHVLLRAIGPTWTSLPQHMAYAVGASVAICIAGGFVLHWASSLTPLGWAVWLVVVTSVLTCLALGRSSGPLSFSVPRLQTWHVLVLALAALITTGAYALAVRDEARQKEFRYTEFWMIPGAGRAGMLLVGIRSAEPQSQRFDVEITLDGRTIALWPSIAVEPGEVWTRNLVVAPAARISRAEARLYRPQDNSLYRRVSAIIRGT